MRELTFPTSFQAFDLTRNLTNLEFEKIKQGLQPVHMDSKWIIYFEDSWAYFHRVLRGKCIYKVHLVNTDTGAFIDQLMVNADLSNYQLHPETAVQDFLGILQLFFRRSF